MGCLEKKIRSFPSPQDVFLESGEIYGAVTETRNQEKMQLHHIDREETLQGYAEWDSLVDAHAHSGHDRDEDADHGDGDENGEQDEERLHGGRGGGSGGGGGDGGGGATTPAAVAAVEADVPQDRRSCCASETQWRLSWNSGLLACSFAPFLMCPICQITHARKIV